ncbi:MAG TPA: hypothetical protein VIA10_16480 [Gaiellaceae bacterium]
MSTDTLTKQKPAAPVADATQDDELRRLARKRVLRGRKVKENVALFLIGMAVLIPIWLVVEWQSAGGFERWSDGDNPGDWDPWILWIAVPWLLWVVLVALHAHFDRETEDEVERELRRLRAGRPPREGA